MDATVAPSHRAAQPPGEERVDKWRYEADVAQAIRAATVVREQEAQRLRQQAQVLEAHAGGFARRNGAQILQGGRRASTSSAQSS